MVVVGTIALCHARKAFPFFQEFLRGCVRFCALTRGHNFLEQLRHRVGRTAGRQRRRRRRRMIGEGTTNTIGENRENRRERLYARREIATLQSDVAHARVFADDFGKKKRCGRRRRRRSSSSTFFGGLALCNRFERRRLILGRFVVVGSFRRLCLCLCLLLLLLLRHLSRMLHRQRRVSMMKSTTTPPPPQSRRRPCVGREQT